MTEEVLTAIEKNKSTIVIPGKARFAWLMGRLFPSLVEKIATKALKIERNLDKNGKLGSTNQTFL